MSLKFPPVSDLDKTDIGKLYKSKDGKEIRILKKKDNRISWKPLTRTDASNVLKPLTDKSLNAYYKKMANNLNHEDKLRKMFVEMVSKMQPTKSAYL